jgi:Zn-dependent protease with chaperone function
MTTEGSCEPGAADGDIFAAVYFDGLTNQKHRVTVKPSAALEIADDGVFVAAWAYADIRRADGPENILRLRSIAARPLARLEIADGPAQAQILQLCKVLDGEGSTNGASTRRIVLWSLAAAASLLAVVWFGIPYISARLTEFVPLSLEKRLGEASDKQIRAIFAGKVCASPEGTAALAKLVGRLQTAARLPFPPEPAVLSSTVPNAFALPGGRVYVLNGLIAKTQSPDELAGVLAHELGHVAHRDGLRRLIQDSGTGFLIGLLFGDVTGAGAVLNAGRGMLSSAYSREAEANADRFAVAVMKNLGRPSNALGVLLLRISGPEKDNPLAIFASHPMTQERIAMLDAEDNTPTGLPLLSPGEWQALKDICK